MMSALFEYEHTSWSENCPLCVQLKHRADAAIAELEAEIKSQVEKTIEARQETHLAIIQKREAEATITRIRQSVVHHKQEAALYNNEREYDCLTAVIRIIDKEEG